MHGSIRSPVLGKHEHVQAQAFHADRSSKNSFLSSPSLGNQAGGELPGGCFNDPFDPSVCGHRSTTNFSNRTSFNLFFTMHGTAMIFLVAMPLIFGFANYLVPLMIGTSAFSYKRGTRIITGLELSAHRQVPRQPIAGKIVTRLHSRGILSTRLGRVKPWARAFLLQA